MKLKTAIQILKLSLFSANIPLAIVACSNYSKIVPSNNIQQIAAIQSMADNYMATNTNESGLSGISITVQCNSLNNSQPIIVFSGTMGHDTQYQRPINNNDIWQIGSNTKSFTSIVLIQIASEPQYNFSLDDPINKWINSSNYPALQNLLRDNPTIRQMMNMTSGIPNNLNMLNFIKTNPYTYESPSFWINFADANAVVTPGTNWTYSNTNYNLFGILVPLVTGKSLQTEIEQRIIQSLNLDNTHFITNLPSEQVNISNLVHGYGIIHDILLNNTYNYSLSSAIGSGNIVSTTNDMNTYYRSLFKTNKLLSHNQLTQLSSFVSDVTGQTIKSPAKSQNGYGFGLGVTAWDFNHKKHLIPKDNLNLMNNLNNYSLVYTYTGVMLGYQFIFFYNPHNNASVIVGYNNNDVNPTTLPINILNYMDPICH